MILHQPPVHNFLLREPDREPVVSTSNRDFTLNGRIKPAAKACLNLFGVAVELRRGVPLSPKSSRQNLAQSNTKYFPQRGLSCQSTTL